MMKKMLLAALITASFGTVAVPAVAAVYVIHQAPPAPREEAMPSPRHGYVWAPGHWEWRHNRHAWVGGNWIRARHGYVYNAPTWEERNGGWHMRRGNWARGDRDGDGVPNGVDTRPNNPNRN